MRPANPMINSSTARNDSQNDGDITASGSSPRHNTSASPKPVPDTGSRRNNSISM